MKIKIVLFISVIILSLVFFPCGSGSTYKQTYDTKDNWFTTGSLFVNRVGDRFTVNIKSIRLQDVLKELSSNYGIKFLLPSSLADEEVMVRFKNLKLDEGIKKILASYNKIFIYLESKGDPPVSLLTNLHEVRIYSSIYKKMGKDETFITISQSGSQVRGETAKSNDKLVMKSLTKLSGELGNNDAQLSLRGVMNEASTINRDEPAIDPLPRAMRGSDSRVSKVSEDIPQEIKESPKEMDNIDDVNNGDRGKEKGKENDKENEGDGIGGNEDENRAERVEPACTRAIKNGDVIIVPIKVTGEKSQTIEAWGFDVSLDGLKYVTWIKSGCLAEESGSFMCNQLANGNVRCGSYTGELNVEGENILFELELKEMPNAKSASIRLLNFVDNLADAKTSTCQVK